MNRVGLLILIFQLIVAPLLGSPVRVGRISDNLSLNDLARRFNLKVIWLEKDKKVLLKNAQNSLSFEVNKRDFELNDTTVYLGKPVCHIPGSLVISKKDFEKTIKPLLSLDSFTPPPKLHRIVIDPGHGGKDVGAISKQLRMYEKDLTLDIARRLKKLLEEKGYNVLMTRNFDKNIDCEDRCKWANQEKADLLVSIHINSVSQSLSREIQGVESYILTPESQPSTGFKTLTLADKIKNIGNAYDTWNAVLGYDVQNSLHKRTNAQDRGLKRMRLRVLKDLRCPGILVECGFMSHPVEGRLLMSPDYKQKLADAISQGISAYHRHLARPIR